MAQIFSPKIDKLLPAAGASLAVGALAVAGLAWYYLSPEYTNVGYRPKQPVEYSHKLHAGDLGIDCRYCHSYVEQGAYAGIPPTQTCMNCHARIQTESAKLAPVRASWSTGEPIRWIRVHDLPDFAYFDHSAHLRAGVGCASCHGDVSRMEVVTKTTPMSMGWCLDCHRNPDPHLRPRSEITNMNYVPPANQAELARAIREEKGIAPKDDCTVCHR